MKFKLVAIMASVALALTGSIAANADGYRPPQPKLGESGFNIIDAQYLAGDKASYLAVSKQETLPNGNTVGKATLCTAYGQGDCVEGAARTVMGNVLLGVCVGDEVNCIEGVSIYKKGSTPTAAVLDKLVPGPTLPADIAADIPRGATVGVWKAAGVPNLGGTEAYAAYAKLSFHMEGGKSVFDQFDAGVVPTAEVADSYQQSPTVSTITQRTGDVSVALGYSGSMCVYNYTGYCAVVQDFGADTRVTLTLRISNRLTGWLKGRLQDPVINLTSINAKYNRLSVDASTVSVPQLSAFFTKVNLPSAVALTVPWISDQLNANAGDSIHIPASSQTALDLVEASRAFVHDKGTGVSTSWSFSSLNNLTNGYNRCLDDTTKLVGLVTTNSMVYEGTAPKFTYGTLDYKVAGMHYLADGTEASGVYDLVLRSDAARCLYGFTNAPISATISVTSSNGEAKAAVTNFNEKDGWVHFGAYGFSFSQPTVKVKITQSKSVTPKATTITCVTIKKPIKTKKVTAIAPKCPSGYKKK